MTARTSLGAEHVLAGDPEATEALAVDVQELARALALVAAGAARGAELGARQPRAALPAQDLADRRGPPCELCVSTTRKLAGGSDGSAPSHRCVVVTASEPPAGLGTGSVHERRGRDACCAAKAVDDERDFVEVAPAPVLAGFE